MSEVDEMFERYASEETIRERLIGKIDQALIDACWRMKGDPSKPATLQKRVYPKCGRGRWIGRRMDMWPIEAAIDPLWIGTGGQLYCHDRNWNAFLPARVTMYSEADLRYLLRIVQEI